MRRASEENLDNLYLSYANPQLKDPNASLRGGGPKSNQTRFSISKSKHHLNLKEIDNKSMPLPLSHLTFSLYF